MVTVRDGWRVPACPCSEERMSQAGFDGGSISRTICPWVRRTSADVTTEEVPPGID